MSTPLDPSQLRMDPSTLYREDVYTDRRIGTIRVLTPVTSMGSTDSSRQMLYIGETQLLTPGGLLPLAFEIPDPAFKRSRRLSRPVLEVGHDLLRSAELLIPCAQTRQSRLERRQPLGRLACVHQSFIDRLLLPNTERIRADFHLAGGVPPPGEPVVYRGGRIRRRRCSNHRAWTPRRRTSCRSCRPLRRARRWQASE